VSGSNDDVSDVERETAIVRFRELVASDRLSLDQFTDLSDQVVHAANRDEFAAAVRRAPVPVSFTPPERRMTEPLLFRVNTGSVKMNGRWQVAEETVVKANTGVIELDFSQAEFDAPVIDLDIKVNTGTVRLIVPHGVAVQIVETGMLRNELGDDVPLPGAPLIRLRSRVQTGAVYLQRPKPPKVKRQRWWRRRAS